MNIFTIGFTKKSAEEFFETLKKNKVKKVIDIRLNNKSQLAGFAKGRDLKYLLKEIADIEYLYKPEYAPSKELLKGYRNKEISWEEYEKIYIEILNSRKIMDDIEWEKIEEVCFLCSEKLPNKCHRRLIAEYLKKFNNDIKINHL